MLKIHIMYFGAAKDMSMEERGFKEVNVVTFNILNPNNMIHTCVVNVCLLLVTLVYSIKGSREQMFQFTH